VQTSSWIAVFGLAQFLPLSGAVALALQAALAAAVAWRVHDEPWWIALHGAFSPLVALALAADIDPRWWLAALAVTLALFWGTPGTRVPLYLSGRTAVDRVESLVQARGAHAVLDIGCGIGSVVAPLARRQPQVRVTGIESAPLPWLAARLRTRSLGNASVQRGDFFTTDWGEYDLVYAFLSPHPMTAVWEKARREMHAGALLVSKDFAVPDATPADTIALADGSTLYLYAPAGAPSRRPD
jgi:SAM-dependent methyltransferase